MKYGSDVKIKGTLKSINDTILVVMDESTHQLISLDINNVDKMKISKGKASSRFVIGTVIGGVAGFAIGAISDNNKFKDDFLFLKKTQSGFAGGIVGAGIGALGGIAMGNEKWSTYDLKGSTLKIEPTSGGLSSVGLRTVITF